MRTAHTRPGFTLIEVLVVISIIAILVTLLLPAVQKVRASAANAQCFNNMRQIGLAFHNHEGVKGYLPPYATKNAPKHGWAVYLLPYLEQDAVHAQYDYTQTWSNVANRPAKKNVIPTFQCPSFGKNPRFDTTTQPSFAANPAAVSDYAPISVANGLAYYLGLATTPVPPADQVKNNWTGALMLDEVTKLSSILDGTSRTILIAEDGNRPNRIQKNVIVGTNVSGAGWADDGAAFALDGTDTATATITRGPCVLNCTNANEIYSQHRNGCNFVLCDGSAQFIRNEIDPAILLGIVTRRNGDRTPPPSEW